MKSNSKNKIVRLQISKFKLLRSLRESFPLSHYHNLKTFFTILNSNLILIWKGIHWQSGISELILMRFKFDQSLLIKNKERFHLTRDQINIFYFWIYSSKMKWNLSKTILATYAQRISTLCNQQNVLYNSMYKLQESCIYPFLAHQFMRNCIIIPGRGSAITRS